MFGVLSSAVETGLMVLEPAYRTYKQLRSNESAAGEQERRDGHDERRRLLVHWIVYAVFRAVDCAARGWLPAYGLFNIAAVVWLRAGGGTDTVYRTAVEPFLAEHETAVDHWLHRFDRARDTVNNATAALGSAAAAAVAGAAHDEDDDASPPPS